MRIFFEQTPQASSEDIFYLVEATTPQIDGLDYREVAKVTEELSAQCVQAIYERNPQLAMTLIEQNPMLLFDSRVLYMMYSNLSVLQVMFVMGLEQYLPEYAPIQMPNGQNQPITHETLLGIANRLISHTECKAAKDVCQEICQSQDYTGELETKMLEVFEDDLDFVHSEMTLSYLRYYLMNAFMKQEHFFYVVPFNVFNPIFIRDVLRIELGSIKSASDYLYPRQMDAFYQLRNQFRHAHAAQKQVSYQNFYHLSRAIGNFVDFGLNRELRLLNHVNVLEALTGYGKTRTVIVAALGVFVDSQAYDVPQRSMIVGTRTRSQVRAFLKESIALRLSALGVPSKSLSCSLRYKAIIPENPYWSALLRLSKDSVDKETQDLFETPGSNSTRVREELIETFAGSDICKTCVYNPTNRKGFVPEDYKSRAILEAAMIKGVLPGGLPINISQEDVDLMLDWERAGFHHYTLARLQAMFLDLDTAAEAFLIIFGRCGYRVAVNNLTQFTILIVTYPYLFDRQISKYFRNWCQTNRVVTSHAVVIDEAHGLDKISSDEPALNPELLTKAFYYNEWMFHVQSMLGHARSPLQQLFEFKFNAQEYADIISHTAIGYLRLLRHLEDTNHDLRQHAVKNIGVFFPSAETIHYRLSLLLEHLEILAFELRELSLSTKETLHHNTFSKVDAVVNQIARFLDRHLESTTDLKVLLEAANQLIGECYPSGFAAYTHRNFTTSKDLFSFMTDLRDSLMGDMIKQERYKDLSISDIKMLSFTFHKIRQVFESIHLFYHYLLYSENNKDSWIILVGELSDWSFKHPFGKKLVKHLRRVIYHHADRYTYQNETSQNGYTGTPFILSPQGQKFTSPALIKMLENPDKIGNFSKTEDTVDRYDWSYVPYRLYYPKLASAFLQYDAKFWKKMPGFKLELISNAAVLNSGFLGYNAVYLLSGTMPDNAYLRHFMGLNSHRTAVSKPVGEMTFIVGKGATTKYNERDQHYENYAKTILDIFCQRRLAVPDRHMMVVFSSGQMLLEIYQRCFESMVKYGMSRQELITEKDSYYSDGRLLEFGVAPKYGEHNFMSIKFFTEYLRKRRANQDPTLAFVVAGGRYSEGIEFTHEGRTMVGTIACVGIPIPPPSPKMNALTLHLQNEGLSQWEIFELSSLQSAFQKIRQAIGRANRSDQDKSEIYLLDTRYAAQSYWSRKFPADKVIDVTDRREIETAESVEVPYLMEDDIPF